MKRIYCDGCHQAGVEKELTGRTDYHRVPFLEQNRMILDLCPEVCAPAYERFQWRHKSETKHHLERYRVLVDELCTNFWKELKREVVGSQETINAAKSSPEIGAVQ
jgi:hypothetical protein